ncbi:MAG: rod shape-determining protein MreD [Micavibrio sp.]|nr:rod shape-determining protein MreD [Micavibrio sp.]
MAFRSGDGWQESAFGSFGRFLATFAVLFLLLILSAFPFKIGHFGEIRPSFLLMAIYYWAIMRPSTLPPPATFVVGIVVDLMGGFPTGLNALTFVVVQWVTRAQRKFLLGQSFVVIWMGLMLVTFGAGMLQWLLYSVFFWHFDVSSIVAILMSVVMTSAIFPLIVLPLSAFNRTMAERL